ncbi:MAG: hypothetical protein AB4911_16035 [Oscillochloridaceae bacterium umkhey_bin13]
MSMLELILYACPAGPLADQITAFYATSQARFGSNSAHAYPPHITLTGFFHDEAAALPGYLIALEAAYQQAQTSRPTQPVVIEALVTSPEFHGLLIDSPWLEALSADFANRAVSATRPGPLRLKRDLHLSLAYGFAAEHGPALGTLAQAMVDPAAPVTWQLELYQRHADGRWQSHASWPI